MRIIYSPKFEWGYKKLPLETKEPAERKEPMFRNDPVAKNLKTDKPQGRLSDF